MFQVHPVLTNITISNEDYFNLTHAHGVRDSGQGPFSSSSTCCFLSSVSPPPDSMPAPSSISKLYCSCSIPFSVDLNCLSLHPNLSVLDLCLYACHSVGDKTIFLRTRDLGNKHLWSPCHVPHSITNTSQKTVLLLCHFSDEKTEALELKK